MESMNEPPDMAILAFLRGPLREMRRQLIHRDGVSPVHEGQGAPVRGSGERQDPTP